VTNFTSSTNFKRLTIFEYIFESSDLILTEGAFVERLKVELDVVLDKHINHSGLIYSNPDILTKLYKQYIDIGRKYNIPIMITTPTRRVNKESVMKSDFFNKDIIPDTISFLAEVKQCYGDYSPNIMLGGLLGCKGDAYSGAKIMNFEESYDFHRQQTLQFENDNINFLFAGIMPEITEAIGMAQAMADTGKPYIISFMLRKNGCLLDGTPLVKAMEIIDKKVTRKPICYATNCIHPTNLLQSLNCNVNRNHPILDRFKGIQANASLLCPEELNNCNSVEQDDFSNIIDDMIILHKQHGIKILGGCCGTDDRFIDEMAERIVRENT
jgi:S-methylmethionine-dependent homocysteine/selenocysteine methylase